MCSPKMDALSFYTPKTETKNALSYTKCFIEIKIHESSCGEEFLDCWIACASNE